MKILFNLKSLALLIGWVWLCSSPTDAQVKLHAPAKNKNLREISWLAGKWKTKDSKYSFEEHWMAPGGGSMIGMAREMAGDQLQFFEYLRIEERKDGLVYVAQPRGKAQTDFKLTNENTNTLMFENPAHDFPNTITYEKRSDGSLSITVSGNGPKKNKAFQHILFKQI